jgi:flagellar biosynthesis protein FlhA
MTPSASGQTASGKHDVLVAIAFLTVVAVMILPLPRFLMDFGLSLSITLSLITFLVSIYLRDPLELSVFPTLVLIASLGRLSLNIASTRLILLQGAEGPGAAGNLIKSFGQFVIGGNYAVGIILFLILVVINFMVITKGAGRVAEVSARFTLDAMPGKQMAIDADLAAGFIDEEQARQRREKIHEEAGFHGAMDGASKFVRGDAVAGLIITGINVVAGVAIGSLAHNMPISEALETFTILTVGDGLVSQIPALLISTAAGIVVTRASGEKDLSVALVGQLSRHRKASAIAAGFLGLLGVLPGMPTIILFALAAGLGAVSMAKPKEEKGEAAEAAIAKEKAREQESDEQMMERLLPIDLLELQIGYELVGLVDKGDDGDLLGRISGIRKQFATELGIIVPPVHVRDNLELGPGDYRLLLSGSAVGGGEVRVGRFLAMDPGTGVEPVPGEDVIEPAFGLPARWIIGADRAAAEARGFTVVDAATVVATHLSELLRKNGHELLGRGEMQQLLDIFSKTHASLVDELIPNVLPLGEVIKVMRNLLSEGVSIRDMRTILETLADYGANIKDPDVLTELVRQRMAKQLTSRVKGDDGRVHALVLDPQLEEDLRAGLAGGPAGGASFEGHALPRVLGALERAMGKVGELLQIPVLIVSPEIRVQMAAFVGRHVPGLAVYSYREIEPNTPIQTLAVVGGAG